MAILNTIMKAMTTKRETTRWMLNWGYRLRLCFNCYMILMFLVVVYCSIRSYICYYQASHLSPVDFGLPADTPHKYFPSPLANSILMVTMSGICVAMFVCNRNAWRKPDEKDSNQ